MDATAVGGEDCDGCRGHRSGKDRRGLIDVAGFCSDGRAKGFRAAAERLASPAASVNAVARALTLAFSLRQRPKTALGLDKADNALEAFALPQVRHYKWPFAAHPPGVGVHFFQ